MNNFRIILLAISLCLSFSAVAQNSRDFKVVSDPGEIKQKIKQVSAATATISSEFRQEKHLTMMSEVLVSDGRFFFRKENDVRWEYVSPISYAIIIYNNRFTINNDGKISEYNTESNKLFSEINNMIVMAIQGDFVENPEFESTFLENDVYYQARLKPVDNILQEILTQIDISFSKASMDVTSVKFTEPGNDYTLITFTNRRTNIDISDELFLVK
jgi:outer membrane lipoprotein-sorting protein